uniref:hypothetical protein n=1 Tax=uncultured Duncaniella sp. TaxID=2768039 RepID=UPI0026F3D53E
EAGKGRYTLYFILNEKAVNKHENHSFLTAEIAVVSGIFYNFVTRNVIPASFLNSINHPNGGKKSFIHLTGGFTLRT